MKVLLNILIIFFAYGTSFSQINEEEITLVTDTANIEGTTLSPKSEDKIPVVLIIAGSGPTDRDGNNPMIKNNSLKMLAEGLYENGIASVRYDKRGVAESATAAIDESDLRFEHYVEDAISWVELLRKDVRFSEVLIAGHSEGSLIGMIAAQKSKVAKVISIAGAGMPAADIIREQLAGQPKMVLDQALPILEKLEKGETVDSLSPMLYSLFRPSVQPYLISWFQYNPQKEIANLEQPVLILQGTTDIQVSVLDADLLAEANPKAEKEVFEGMNHILKTAEADRLKNIQTYSKPDLPLHEGLIDSIVKFINKE